MKWDGNGVVIKKRDQNYPQNARKNPANARKTPQTPANPEFRVFRVVLVVLVFWGDAGKRHGNTSYPLCLCKNILQMIN